MNKKREELLKRSQEEEEISKMRFPRGNEILGILMQRLGGSRTYVQCLDGKTRVARIPGRLKRKLWVRTGDILLIEPWEHGGDERGDIIYKYKPNQVYVLKQKGLLKELDDFKEF